MPTPWSQVSQSDAYKALSLDDQTIARSQYFDQVVAPQIGNDPDSVEAARTQFNQQFGVTKDTTPFGQAVAQQVGSDQQQDQQDANAKDIGIGASAVRGIVGGGARLLDVARTASQSNLLGPFIDPIDAYAKIKEQKATEQQAKIFGVKPEDLAAAKQAKIDQADPVYQAIQDAKDYASLHPGEKQTFGERVAQGGTQAGVEFAGAMAMTPEVGAESLLSKPAMMALAKSSPRLASLATKLIGAAPISASMTAVQDTGQDVSAKDVAADFVTNLAMAGLPQSFGKGFLSTKLTGGLIGADLTLGQQAWHNYWTSKTPSSAQSMPDDHGFDLADVAVGGLMGAMLAQRHAPTSDGNAAFNDLQQQASKGNLQAQQTVDLATKVAQADGMTQTAVQAAQQGQQAAQKVQNASHDILMQSNDRYRQLVDAAVKSGFSPDIAQQQAKATLITEVGDNTAWASYTEASLKQRQTVQQGKLYQQIAQLSGEAMKLIDPDQQLILNRWIETQKPTPVEMLAALQESIQSKEAPQPLQDVYGEDFNKDGTFTEQAFRTDQRQHPDAMTVFYAKTPQNLKLFQQAGARPYVLDDRYAILGAPGKVTQLTDAIHATTGELPVLGENDEIQTRERIHPSAANQSAKGANDQAGAAVWNGQGDNAREEGQPGGEGYDQAGENDGAGENDQGAQESTVNRAKAFINRRLEALDRESASVRSSGTMRALKEEKNELEDLLREQYGRKQKGALGAPGTRLSDDELKQAQDRFDAITQQMESHRAARTYGDQAASIRKRLQGASDQDIQRIAEELYPQRAQTVTKELADVPRNEVGIDQSGKVTIHPQATEEHAQAGMDAAAMDTAASNTDFAEPTPGQIASGNYRKGGVIFKSPDGDIPVRIENPAGSIRRGTWGSRPLKDAHYGYIPGTVSGDGSPLDVLLTRQAHDPSRKIAVISQHDPNTGAFDELKVVMGAKNRGDAMATYLKQYPADMHEKLLPQGKGNVVMMERGKFTKFIGQRAVDVPPHPISGQPMFQLRKNGKFEVQTRLNTEQGQKAIERFKERYGIDLQQKEGTIQGAIPKAHAQAAHEFLSRIGGKPESTFEGKPLLRQEVIGESPRTSPVETSKSEREPGAPLHPWTPVADDVSIPLTGGVSDDGHSIYLDKRLPATVKVDGKTVDVHDLVGLHERTEWPLMHLTGPMDRTALEDLAKRTGYESSSKLPFKVQAKLSRGKSLEYVDAHALATRAENQRYKELYGGDPDAYQKSLTEAIDKARKEAPHESDVPSDLDARPYTDEGDGHLLQGKTDADLTKGPRLSIQKKGPEEINASGESSASLEAQRRLADEKIAGQTRAIIRRDGSIEPLIGVDAVDTHARDGEVVVQRGIGKEKWSILSHGDDVSRDVARGNLNRAMDDLNALHEGRGKAATEEGERPANEFDLSSLMDEENTPQETNKEQEADALKAKEYFHDQAVNHVTKIAKQWVGDYPVQVLRHPDEIDDPALREYVKQTIPEDITPGGLYHNGKVIVFSHAHEDLYGIERTIAHEMVGHFGLRGLFHGNGDDFHTFLDQVHGSVMDSPLFKEIELSYRQAYKGMKGDDLRRAVTEEYIAHLAESRKEPSLWKKIVAHVKALARKLGLVSRWTDDDLYHLLGRVASDLRNGRIGLGGMEAPETRFENDGKSTSTYVGPGGRGDVSHYDDGSRDLDIEGLKATIQHSTLGDKEALSVGDLSYAKPEDLQRLARFAGEESKDVVAISKGDVSKADLDASGVPYTDRMGFYELKATPSKPGPMFSLRNRASAGKTIDDLVEKTVDHSDLTMTPWDRFQRAMRNIRDGIASGDSVMRLKAGYVDAGAPFMQAETRLNGGLLLDAAQSPYKMFWMSKNNEQITAGILKVGVPKYVNGSFKTVAGRQGLVDILSPLFRTPDGKAIDHLWEAYAYASRANELIKEINPDGTSREKLLTQPEIDQLLALDKKYPIFQDILDRYQRFNHQLLDLAVDRGAMSSETADLWKQNMYVPFYRHQEETENNTWQFSRRGISNKKVTSKRLWGSEKKVDPIIDNIVRNTGSILDKIYSNEAMRRVAALGEQAGVMERVKHKIDNVSISMKDIEKTLMKMGFYVGQKQGPGKYSKMVSQQDLDRVADFIKMSRPIGNDIVTVYQGGKPVFYRVNDDTWYKAITSFDQIGTFDRAFNFVFGGPKKLLTMATIYNPGFMFRTFIRDAVTAWMQTGTNPNMLKNAFSNAKDVFTDSQFQNSLRAAGFNGNAYFNAHEMREHMEEIHGKNGWTLLSTPKKLWHAYHKIGMMAEQINRLSVAKHILERGGSVAEAAWQGQNTLNFKMRGSNKAMQLLIRTVPFLNARIQGLNRLYLGMSGKDVTANRSRAVASYVVKALGVMGASLALQLNNENDPRYQRIPEEDKDLYYHLFIGNTHYTLPKPFETGAMFSTIPERAMRALQGKDTERTWVESMQRTFLHTLEFDPTPQTVKPLIEDWANKDSLTGRPIVSQQYQDLQPAQQDTPYGSPFLAKVAGGMPAVAPDTLRSPLRLEHLYRGYTAAVGMWLLQGADAMTRNVYGSPKQPTSRYGNTFLEQVMGPLGASPSDNDPRNKYVQQLYDAQDDADQAYHSLLKVARDGDAEETRRIAGDNKTALQYRATLHTLTQEMGEMRKAEMATMDSRSMTPDQKRERLDRINETRTKILDKVGPILDIASDYH